MQRRLAFALLLTGVLGAHAQDFPTRPIRMIAPVGPGAAVDIVGRVMAEGMTKMLGQPVIVENRPGGQASIGYEYVAKSAPDGYTIAPGAVPSLAAMSLAVKDLRFDPVRDLPPFIGLGETRYFLAVNPSVPAKTLGEFVAHAKANPGKLNYGTLSGAYTAMIESLLKPQGVNIVRINYSVPLLQPLVAGEIQFAAMTAAQFASIASRVRPLAVTGAQRDAAYPDVPTLAELGHPLLRGAGYQLNVAAGTPKPIIAKLHDAASSALRQPDVRARLAKLYVDIDEQTAEVAANNLLEQGKFYADIGKQIGLKPE
jgi:tripartite-type tricarboxylate transporter receptor subunit TctC